MPYLRDDKLARPWAVPGTPGLRHRIGGLEKEDVHRQHLLRAREPRAHDAAARRADRADRRGHARRSRSTTRRRRRRCWCSAGARATARSRARRGGCAASSGLKVATAHLRHLNPLPRNLGEVLRAYERVLVPEMNMGQLVDAAARRVPRRRESYTKVDGLPIFTARRDGAGRWSAGMSENGTAAATAASCRARQGGLLRPTRRRAGARAAATTRSSPRSRASCPSSAIPPEKIVFVTGHRLRRPLRLLHGHLRDARHPRPRAGARDRRGDLAPRPLGVGRHRRRRRALDRRQPPDPRPAPQRAAEDPALQQPDLRAHQGPVLADQRGGQGHQVDAVRLAGPSLQPGRAGARRRGDLRRPHGRHRQGAHGRRRCARPPRTRARPSSRSTRTATSSTTAPSTPCAAKGRSEPNQIRLEHGEPIRFGADGERGVVARRRRPPRAGRRRRRRRGRAGRPRRPPRRPEPRLRARAAGRPPHRPDADRRLPRRSSARSTAPTLRSRWRRTRAAVGREQLEELLHSGETWTVS